MFKRILSLILAGSLFNLGICTEVAFAATYFDKKCEGIVGSSQEWERVMALPVGDELVVKLKDGKTLKGRLRNASETTLTLSQTGKGIDLPRGNIFRIHRTVLKSGGSKALLGAGIGAGIGLAMGSLNDDNKAATMPILAVIGAGIGALIGLATRSHTTRVLIYEAK